ncbi:sensor histidine kinase, partial [Staphylococcus capitis]
MLIFIIIVLIIGILFLTYKYLALKRDVSQLTIQLQQLSQDISSNQRLRTTTQFHEMQQLTKALNHM